MQDGQKSVLSLGQHQHRHHHQRGRERERWTLSVEVSRRESSTFSKPRGLEQTMLGCGEEEERRDTEKDREGPPMICSRYISI